MCASATPYQIKSLKTQGCQHPVSIHESVDESIHESIRENMESITFQIFLF